MKWTHKANSELVTGTFPAAGAKWIWIYSYYESERHFDRSTYSINRSRWSLLKCKRICSLITNDVARNMYFNQGVKLRISVVIDFSQRSGYLVNLLFDKEILHVTCTRGRNILITYMLVWLRTRCSLKKRKINI
jgi:hypothetical protein